ncbi:hypothetical protein LguiA_026254 [Lonicera macranthoides]
MDMDLDLDDHDVPRQEPTRKFAPKNSKLKPKPKLKAEPLASEPPPPLPQELDSTPSIGKEELDAKPPLVDSITTKTEYEPSHISAVANSTVKMDIEETLETEEPKEDLMEEDKNEDQVVREIDVYFSPPVDPNTELYVLQYPLRPCWRPYEIDERCEEVRVKSQSSEVEMDLSVDVDSKNYDTDASDKLKMTKQVLSTVWKPRRTTGYVVGVLVDNKLHLNPIHSVVQLRPSMQHLNKPGNSKKKNSAVSQVEMNKPGPSNQQNKDIEEPWIPLKYHDSKSDISTRYRRKMVAQTDYQIPFSMTSYEYLSSLCPTTSNQDTRSKGPSRRILLSLPLEDRYRTWLLEGPPIHRFNALKHLAPNDSDEDVLLVLKDLAHVIQGLWVPQSRLLYRDDQGSVKLARDYVLLLFSKNPIISSAQLPQKPELLKHMKEVLNVLAVERPTLGDWKFKEPRDVSFIKLHPDIVKQHEKEWDAREEKITECVYGGGSKNSSKRTKPATVDRPVASKNLNKVAPKTSNAASSRPSMPDETREALPKALQKLFQFHKVCSFEQICQRLRDTAISESARPKGVPRELVAAAKGVDFRDELLEIVNQVAIEIHGVFVWKSSVDHPQYNDLRSIVIGLLKAERNAKLKKAAVIEAAKMQLNREITNPEFQKVISELCTSQGSAWVLKSGDGNPK